MHHVCRVFRLGMRLAEETSADRVARGDRARRDEETANTVAQAVVGAAALVHDVHRVKGDGTGVDPGEIAGLLVAADLPGRELSMTSPSTGDATSMPVDDSAWTRSPSMDSWRT
jgi:hypothetical protein